MRETVLGPQRQSILPAARDSIVDVRFGKLQVRLAESMADIDAAQALRYRVFYEEMGARPTAEMARVKRDIDSFDGVCDHLLVVDHARGSGPQAVVGTYRLIRRAAAERHGGFYSAAEYDVEQNGGLSRRNPRARPLLRRCRRAQSPAPCSCSGAASPPTSSITTSR